LRVTAFGFVGLVVGAALGFAAGIFVYPYIFLADVVAMERAPSGSGALLASGQFIHANSADPVHYGKGRVSVFGNAVRLEEDFEVGPGPKFHVYLVPAANVTSAAQVRDAMFVDLGRLRAFKGAQNYEIPAGVDLSKFGSVVIWCEAFSVLISPATLTRAAS
jgi:hypothetical protein